MGSSATAEQIAGIPTDDDASESFGSTRAWLGGRGGLVIPRLFGLGSPSSYFGESSERMWEHRRFCVGLVGEREPLQSSRIYALHSQTSSMLGTTFLVIDGCRLV